MADLSNGNLLSLTVLGTALAIWFASYMVVGKRTNPPHHKRSFDSLPLEIRRHIYSRLFESTIVIDICHELKHLIYHEEYRQQRDTRERSQRTVLDIARQKVYEASHQYGLQLLLIPQLRDEVSQHLNETHIKLVAHCPACLHDFLDLCQEELRMKLPPFTLIEIPVIPIDHQHYSRHWLRSAMLHKFSYFKKAVMSHSSDSIQPMASSRKWYIERRMMLATRVNEPEGPDTYEYMPCAADELHEVSVVVDQRDVTEKIERDGQGPSGDHISFMVLTALAPADKSYWRRITPAEVHFIFDAEPSLREKWVRVEFWIGLCLQDLQHATE